MLNRLALVLAVLSSALFALPHSAAAADKVHVAVLGLESADGAPEAVAASITDALKQAVAGRAGYTLVKGADLLEVKTIYFCPDEAPSCMSEAAKNLGASKLIFGSIRKAGDVFLVSLKMLDAGKKQIENLVADQITRAQASGPAVRGPVTKWLAALTGQSTGLVKVTGNVPGASVALDGLPVGVIGPEPLALTGITPGRHEIMGSKPGWPPVKVEVNVTAGGTAEANLAMGNAPATAEPAAPVAAAPTPTSAPETDAPADAGAVDKLNAKASTEPVHQGGGSPALKGGTWAVLGAGLVAIGLGVKFGLDVKSINSDLDKYRWHACKDSPTGFCTLDNQPAPKVRPTAQQDFIKNKTADGDRLAKLQYVSYGVGVALLGVGAYLGYKAYLSNDSGEATATRRPAGSGFQLLPIADAHGAGLLGLMTF